MTDQPWYMKNYKEQFTAKPTNRLLSKIEAALAIEQAERNSHRDTKHFHSSEMAKDDWCPRSTWYKIMDTEESDPQSMNLKRMNIFAEGHNIHDKWQRWMWKAGGLWGNWACKSCDYRWEDKSPQWCPVCSSDDVVYKEVPLSNEEYSIIGHADGVWEDDKGRAVVEIKSVGLGTIRWDAPKLYEGYDTGDLSLDDLWKRIKRPLTTHRRQVNLYMMCLGIEDAIVLYEWKPSQEVKEFHLKYTPELIEPILKGITEVKGYLEDGVVPPKPVVATHKSCSMCKFCSYKSHCWSKA
jgi:rubrerythrin